MARDPMGYCEGMTDGATPRVQAEADEFRIRRAAGFQGPDPGEGTEPERAEIRWAARGGGKFETALLEKVARDVWRARCPAQERTSNTT